MSPSQLPTPPVEQSTEAESLPAVAPQKKNRRVRNAMFAGLLVLLACSIWLWANYLTTRKPITESIPVAQVAAQVIKPHYLFSIYGATQPLGIAVTADGSRIYVGEGGGERMVRVFDKDGKEMAKFTAPGANKTRSAPVSISLDSQGRVFVADSMRRTVDVYDAGGNFKKTYQPPVKEGWVPVGLQVEGKSVLVAGRNNGAEGFFSMTLDGQFQYLLGKHGEDGTGDGFYSPGKAVIDARGRYYVSDSMNQRVAVFDDHRKYLYSIPNFNHARGMVIDDAQRLYVVDTFDHMVKVFDVGGAGESEHLFDFGDYGVGNGEFNFPNDAALDTAGRLYITDRASNRVQVWAY